MGTPDGFVRLGRWFVHSVNQYSRSEGRRPIVRRMSFHYLVTISHLDFGFKATEGSAVLANCHSQKKIGYFYLEREKKRKKKKERKKERKRYRREESWPFDG